MKKLVKSENQQIVKSGWCSRGNPSFWDYIAKELEKVELRTTQELADFIKRLHKDVTKGKELTADSYEYAEKFAKGQGMSDGMIDGWFWLGETDAINKIAEYLDLK